MIPAMRTLCLFLLVLGLAAADPVDARGEGDRGGGRERDIGAEDDGAEVVLAARAGDACVELRGALGAEGGEAERRGDADALVPVEHQRGAGDLAGVGDLHRAGVGTDGVGHAQQRRPELGGAREPGGAHQGVLADLERRRARARAAGCEDRGCVGEEVDAGRVGASAEKENVVEVSVTDTGRGIPDTQTDRIFDRLYQVKTGDATTEHGVGLGLFICRELVRLHGGDIRVQSTVGQGSTFTFELPLKAPVESRSNLLLVDDDPAMREILSGILQRAKFDVATAEDGNQALLQIRKHVPDVILMDLEMPGMDGPTTLQEIRREWGALPVVLHTGHVDGPLLSRALECAPFTVLSKPCPMDQLVQTMRGVDRRRSGETEHKTNPQASPTPAPGKAKETVAA